MRGEGSAPLGSVSPRRPRTRTAPQLNSGVSSQHPTAAPFFPVPASALLALALAPFLASIVFTAWGVLRWRRWRVQPHWPEVPAKVVALVSTRHATPAGFATQFLLYTYARYVYEYRVAGTAYTAELEQVPARPTRGPRASGPLRVGSTLRVRYDPAAPGRSVPVEHWEWAAPACVAAGALAFAAAAWLAWQAWLSLPVP
jgi:hypothetical protein